MITNLTQSSFHHGFHLSEESGFAVLRFVIKWVKYLALLSLAIRSTTETSCNLFVSVFPHLAPITCTGYLRLL